MTFSPIINPFDIVSPDGGTIMGTRTIYTEEQKLAIIKTFLESNLSMTQFCNVNNVNYYTLRAWLNWYNEKKDAWQLASIDEEKEIKEETLEFKETSQKIDDQEFHQYRTITIELSSIKITCDKSPFKDVWRIVNND